MEIVKPHNQSQKNNLRFVYGLHRPTISRASVTKSELLPVQTSSIMETAYPRYKGPA